MDNVLTKEQWKDIVCTINFPEVIDDNFIELLLKYPEMADAFMRWGFCYYDLSNHDLSGLSEKYLRMITFNSSTKWPNKEKMPRGFNPSEIMGKAKFKPNAIKQMHEVGITGEGVSVAMIDFSLQDLDHQDLEKADISVVRKSHTHNAHFHGSCVLANLCGKAVGIAPKVKVLYYERLQGDDGAQQEINVALEDILKRIEEGEKIRVVNVSGRIFFKTNEDLGAKVEQLKTKSLVNELEQHNCVVVSSEVFNNDFSMGHFNYDLDYSSPDDIEKPHWVDADEEEGYKERVILPCGGKVVPEFCSKNGYKYEWDDCASWTIPQAVGLYSLCLQVNKSLTWKDFVTNCHETAVVNQSGFRIINPAEVLKVSSNKKVKKSASENDSL